MSTPIARYDERRFDGRRQFQLFPDRIEVSGASFLGARFEEHVPLEGLSAAPDRLWTRAAGFWSGIGLAIVLSIIPLGFDAVLSSWWKGLCWVLAAGGVLLALATSRRVEWAVFRNSAGIAVLTIARAGPHRDQFQGFVDAVRKATVTRSTVQNVNHTDT